jgi:UDP-glucose 4-epimerase
VSVDDPVHDARANVVGSLQLLQACRRAGIRRFYFASSGGTVYGHQREFPATEDHPTRPTSPYGCSKLAVEHYLLAFGRVGELEPVIVRYANVYGARQDPKGEAGIVAILAEKLLAGEPPTIFGDGSQTRDYVHVDDVTAAHRAVIRAWQPGVYNFGTGIESSVNQVLAEVSVRLGSRIEPRHAPANPAEILRSSLSPERFATTFGVRPTVPLGEGLDRTLPFYRRRAVPAEAR